jgi:uncharacterized Zn finger protein (UPF0148 family)
MNVNMLCPMINPETNKLVFMDFQTFKTYELKFIENEIKLEQVVKEVSESCFEDVKQQQKSMEPEIPIEQIYEVINTEKKLSQQNQDHIFRRKAQL